MCMRTSVGSGPHLSAEAFLRIRRPTPTQEAVPALAANRYPDPACHVRGYPAPTNPLANPGRHRGRKRSIRTRPLRVGPRYARRGASRDRPYLGNIPQTPLYLTNCLGQLL